MASLTVKTIKGKKYYYARVCKRVNGKPKVVQTTYLGSLETIIKKIQRPSSIPDVSEVIINEFGATAALYQIAQKLKFVEIIDRHLPKRKQGPSFGQFMLVAAINRASMPSSKAGISDWFSQTIGPRLLGIKPSELSSQTYWNHMNQIDQDALANIENDLVDNLIKVFNVRLDCLLYDATNFYTYINTKTLSELAQRGRNKQKRNDLRQVSLAMMTSTDFHVPLMHMVYGGNIGDAPQFGSVIEVLVKRYKKLVEACPCVTLVFDKGNNSEDNFLEFKNTGMHFVGSLRPDQAKELLNVPLRKYRELEGEGLEKVKAYRVSLKVFQEERTVVITHNEKLLAGQLQGISRNISKSRNELAGLQTRLKQWVRGEIKRGRKPSVHSVEKNVNKILQREFMKDIFKTEITLENDFVTLSWRLKQNTLSRLTRLKLGKTILFTDNHNWSDEEIVRAYRGQYNIEHAFRDMKNPHYLGWNPRYHRIDKHIRVHAFYCVNALTLVCLLRSQLAASGISLSLESLMEQLNSIRETISVYTQGKNGPPRLSYSLSRMAPIQKKLYELLNLKQYRQS